MATRILVVDDSPTIRRVVSTILERHGYEPAQASDGEDAMNALSSGEVKADLVLIDFVMPRMNGFQFCRALRANAELQSTPVVLMSAKADRIRDMFVQQTGAVDAISKPFDAQALVTVVENALRRVTSGRASSARLPDEDAELELTDESPPVSEFETRRTHIAQIVASKLASIVVGAVGDKVHVPSGDLAVLLAEKLDKDAIVEMIEVVREVEGATGGPLLAGDLGVVPIGAILQLLQAENQSGVLVCRSGSAEVAATFRNGLIDLVQSVGAGDEFRLGRFFVEEGILKPAEIDAVMKQAKDESSPTSRIVGISVTPDTFREDPQTRSTIPFPSKPPQAESDPALSLRTLAKPRMIGAMLLQAGKITRAQLERALLRQSSELLYEVLRWSKGRFDFRAAAPSERTDRADAARLGLPVATVVMEGFRRVDEWRLLERTLGSFDSVLARDDAALGAAGLDQMPERERKLLDLVDGARTIRQVVAESHMSSFDACRILVQLLEARVIRPRA
ncbi:MAG TPA: response regulator [Labilithrix sp.]